MDYKTEELSYSKGQLQQIDEEYTKLLNDYMLVYVYDNKTERKTLGVKIIKNKIFYYFLCRRLDNWKL